MKGFLLLADISGYTGYLNESELEHAQGTLSDLLQVLIDRSGPPLTVSKLEGDAVFSYGFSEAFPSGQTLVEIIEGTYAAFRQAVDSMVLNNTCRCNACANVSKLDLKFVVHHGTFLIQDLEGRSELIGADVNLAHRLLKNSVVESTGIHAYCLYTAAVADVLQLAGLEGLTRHSETVPDFDVVETYIQDVGAHYEATRVEVDVDMSEDEIFFVLEADFPMPPAVLWDYLSDPDYRNILVGTERQEISDRQGGRVGVGSSYLCYHGNQVVPHTIIEWRPFTKIVTEDLMPKPWKGTTLSITRLTEAGDGTHLSRELGGIEGPAWMQMFMRLGVPKVMERIQRNAFSRFVEAVDSDWASRAVETGSPSIDAESIRRAARAGLDARRDGLPR